MRKVIMHKLLAIWIGDRNVNMIIIVASVFSIFYVELRKKSFSIHVDFWWLVHFED